MIIIFLFIFFVSNVYAAMPNIKEEIASITDAIKKVDTKCTQLKQHGPCMVGKIPGVRISYFEPTFVIKTLGNKANSNALSGGNLQFSEVHVYDFPLKQIQQTVLCASLLSNTVGIRYLSELNQMTWRQEKSRGRDFIGNWGPLYPRTGFINHYSQAVSSALAAVRGVSAAGFGVYTFSDRMQMVEPDQLMCMPPGTDARVWENHHISRNGKYTWIYWRFRECCKTVVPDPASL